MAAQLSNMLLFASAAGAASYAMRRIDDWGDLASSSHALCVAGGILIAFAVQYCLPALARAVLGTGKRKRDALYGLQHGRLNIPLPPSMWMNMGYWEATEDFTEACRNLLLETLRRADVTSLRGPDDCLSILDLGFGCGEQTLCIQEWLSQQVSVKYVGVTLNRSQHEYAQRRISQTPVCRDGDLRLFCADAARPESWEPGLSDAVHSLHENHRSTGNQDTKGNNKEVTNHKWVLALDTLYHFSPSRMPVFNFAARELGAGLMAFDIIRSDSATFWQRLLLRIAALLGSCPSNAFVTEEEYRHMLIRAGYSEGSIEFHDITKHVFTPLITFMKRQEAELRAIGLGMGDLVAAGKLFTWWGKSQVVRGVIVTARLQG